MLKNLMITDSARESFFPTPLDLTVKLLADLDWNSIENVLEPSAGKGDLVRGIAERILLDNQCGHKVNVDCIEFDPYLRSVLQYEFMGQKQNSEPEVNSALRKHQSGKRCRPKQSEESRRYAISFMMIF